MKSSSSWFRRSRASIVRCASVRGGGMSALAPGSRLPLRARGGGSAVVLLPLLLLPRLLLQSRLLERDEGVYDPRLLQLPEQGQ